MLLTRGRIVFYGHLTQLRQGIDAPSDSIFEHIDLGRPPISLALRKCGDKLGALRFRETVRIAGYVVHGVIQLLIAGGSDDVRRFDPEGARIQQLPGADYRAAGVRIEEGLGGLSMDLAPAYPPVPGLTRYSRTVRLTEGGLTLTDETDYPGLTALSLMSVEKPAVTGDRAVELGDLGRVTLDAPARIEVEAVPLTDPRLRIAWPDTLYRTRIYFTGRLALGVE
ncbi:MAG: hypothetical protein ACLTNY_04455 [Blautia massiliensis (ex Durand et al. 2017)]